VKARLALARDFARDPAPSALPQPQRYALPLLRVEHGGLVHWLEAGARMVPFGALPPGAPGAEALVLPEPGEAPERVRVPEGDPAPAREVTVAIALRPDGSAAVEGSERWSGYEGAALRASLEQADAQQRRQAMEQLLSRSFRGGVLEELTFDGEERPREPLRLRWRLSVPAWARREADRLLVDEPVMPPRLAARFAQRAARETPLLVSAPERQIVRIVVTPPPGWRPMAGEGSDLETRYGRYRRSERVEGGRLVREEGLSLERGRVPPSEWVAFGAFVTAVDDAQSAPMVFTGTTPGVADDPPSRSAKWAEVRSLDVARPGTHLECFVSP
jgi:hypothetical protein